MTAPFDFASYLYRHTGIHHWLIHELTGGAANYTVRVKQDPRHNHDSCAQGSYFELVNHDSVVMKQAPGYLAKVPEIPFSPYRQTIEATALRLFHTNSDGESFSLSRALASNPSIRIPELLVHDITDNVLVQSDLGDHPNLYEVLTSPATSTHQGSGLGRIIAQFLADLHQELSTDVKVASATDSLPLIERFRNEDADRLMTNVIAIVTTVMKDAGISDHEELGKVALNNWVGRKKTVFGQGDLWFGTLLVDAHAALSSDTAAKESANDSTLTVGICDWEFAGPNDPAADIAQLGSYLHLLSMSPLTTPSARDVLFALADTLYGTYFTASPRSHDLSFVRSLLIMHGWEMINAAAWKSRQHMWCNCPGEGVRCSHIEAMISEGAHLLRAAGPSLTACIGQDGVGNCVVDLQFLEDTVPWSRFFRQACHY